MSVIFVVYAWFFGSALAQYYDLNVYAQDCCFYGIFRDAHIILVADAESDVDYVHCVFDRTDNVNGEDFWIGYQCVAVGTTFDFVRWEYAAGDQCNGTPVLSTNANQIDDTFHGRLQETCCDWADNACGYGTASKDQNKAGGPGGGGVGGAGVPGFAGELLPPLPTPSPTAPPVTTTTTTTSTTTTTTTRQPTVKPTQMPTKTPTAMPSLSPTAAPSAQPTRSPTPAPTPSPTPAPTRQPSLSPSTWAPTRPNQKKDTRPPTPAPTAFPTRAPTCSPTDVPSLSPSNTPSVPPTSSPSDDPTLQPTAPTLTPTKDPSSEAPSALPSNAPTLPMYGDVTDADDQGSDDQGSDQNVDADEAARSAMKIIQAQVMPSVPVHIVCLLLVLIFFCLLLRAFFCPKDADRRQIQSSIKITVILTFVANIVGTASLLAMTTVMMTAEQWDVETWNRAFVALSLVSVAYIAGKASMQMFYVLRVRNAFRDSALAMSSCTVAGLCLLLLVIALAWLFSLVLDQRQWTAFDRDYDYLVLASLDTFMVSVLLLLFVKKLNALVLMQSAEFISEPPSQTEMVSCPPHEHRQVASLTATSTIDSAIAAEMRRVVGLSRAVTVDSVQNSLSDRQTRVVFVMTRCILLNVVAFATTIMYGFFAFYYVRNGTHLSFLYSAWSLDMLINSICLYLNFTFAGHLYRKCCGCCHKQCQHLMQYCAAKQILYQHNKSMEEQVSEVASCSNETYHE